MRDENGPLSGGEDDGVDRAMSARAAARCVLALALLALSGCGGSTSKSTSTVTSSPAASAHVSAASTSSATQPSTPATHPAHQAATNNRSTTRTTRSSSVATTRRSSPVATARSVRSAARSRSGSHGSQPARSTATIARGGSSNYSPVIPPGTMEIASSAFPGENVALPAQYTCDGANISPPLEWRNLPAHTAALVLSLSMIDNAGSTVRWTVANISPSATSVAEGKTPEGGIVGANSEGHSEYGGICPPHGQTASIQIELFALSHTVAVSTGFQASQLEHEYTTGKLMLGTAVDTTTYRRP
jgi:Raf kinase inhibitor-like YbhB/YbcL family protein